jgi:hypothetical protein
LAAPVILFGFIHPLRMRHMWKNCSESRKNNPGEVSMHRNILFLDGIAGIMDWFFTPFFLISIVLCYRTSFIWEETQKCYENNDHLELWILWIMGAFNAVLDVSICFLSFTILHS